MLKDLIEGLIGAGMSESDIAAAVGTSQPTINRIRHGANTSFDTGQKLVRLHSERCGVPGSEGGVPSTEAAT